MDSKHIMMKTDGKERLVLEQQETKTDWREKALWRRKNRHWLLYSGFIALRVMQRLEELNMSQRELATKMDCSPQYVSKLLKGTENLTLETISKLEDSLDLDLVRSRLTYVDGYDNEDSALGRVAEPEGPTYGDR